MAVSLVRDSYENIGPPGSALSSHTDEASIAETMVYDKIFHIYMHTYM